MILNCIFKGRRLYLEISFCFAEKNSKNVIFGPFFSNLFKIRQCYANSAIAAACFARKNLQNTYYDISKRIWLFLAVLRK